MSVGDNSGTKLSVLGSEKLASEGQQAR